MGAALAKPRKKTHFEVNASQYFWNAYLDSEIFKAKHCGYQRQRDTSAIVVYVSGESMILIVLSIIHDDVEVSIIL